jgi:hypothetical protein
VDYLCLVGRRLIPLTITEEILRDNSIEEKNKRNEYVIKKRNEIFTTEVDSPGLFFFFAIPVTKRPLERDRNGCAVGEKQKHFFSVFSEKDKSSQPLVQKMFHQLHFAGSVSSENI